MENTPKKRKVSILIDGKVFNSGTNLLESVPATKIARTFVEHNCNDYDTQTLFLKAQEALIQRAFPIPSREEDTILTKMNAVDENTYGKWKHARDKLLFAPTLSVFQVKISGVIGLTGYYRDATLVPWMFCPTDEAECRTAQPCQHEECMDEKHKGPLFGKNCVTVETVTVETVMEEEEQEEKIQNLLEEGLQKAFVERFDSNDDTDDYCFRLQKPWAKFFEKLSPDILDVEECLEFDGSDYSRHHFAHAWVFYLVPVTQLKEELSSF